MTGVERALVTKELGKAQTALWAAYAIAKRANALDVAKELRERHAALGTKIVELNGGPIVKMKELLR